MCYIYFRDGRRRQSLPPSELLKRQPPPRLSTDIFKGVFRLRFDRDTSGELLLWRG
jgi:hypothetical protein